MATILSEVGKEEEKREKKNVPVDRVSVRVRGGYQGRCLRCLNNTIIVGKIVSILLVV